MTGDEIRKTADGLGRDVRKGDFDVWLDSPGALEQARAAGRREGLEEALHLAKHSPACRGCKRVLARAIRAKVSP